jgi:hypothetical protein
MTMPDIPAEVVEAAARAMYADDDRFDEIGDGWERITDGYREQYRRSAFAVLAAALPHLRERWLAEVEGALLGALRRMPQGVLFTPHQIGIVLRDVLGAGAGGEGQ